MARPKRTPLQRLTPNAVAIVASAVYQRSEVERLLRLNEKAIRREVNASRLRCRYNGNRQLFLGQWLLDWISSEEPSPVV